MTTATAAQMLITGGPAVTLLVAIMLGKETPTRAKWVGIALAGAGALALVGMASEGGRMYGNVIIVVNMMGYAIYLVAARGTAAHLSSTHGHYVDLHFRCARAVAVRFVRRAARVS